MRENWGAIWLLAVAALLLAGCTGSISGPDLLAEKLRPEKSTFGARPKKQDGLIDTVSGKRGQKFVGAYQPGNDLFVGSTGPAYSLPDEGDADITLNLVDVPIVNAARTVLGEVMELNYSVDGRVAGNVTLQTSKPISRRALMIAFENVLRENSAALVEQNGVYRVVPLAGAARSISAIETDIPEPTRPGVRTHVIPLRYVSAEEIKGVLASLLPEGVVLRADTARNMMVLAGTDDEIATIKDTIALFDVDWMKGMSFALIPVKTSDPGAIVTELDTIFDTRKGPSRGIVRFIPNKRLSSVLVISSRAKYLREAAKWVKKLDMLAETNESRLHVYNVQNRTASELAKVLRSVYRTEDGKRVAIESNVAPKHETAVVGTEGASIEEGIGPEEPAAETSVTITESQESGAKPSVRVVADDANNSLLIVSNDAEYDRILRVLERIDAVPNQVLLEAVIAEVSLRDDLRFGVRWFIGEDNDHGTFSDAESGAIASVFPGFSYFLKAADIKLALNALSSVTNVRVLSAPSLMVLDNRTAKLQVGDQVPIVTQSSQSTDAPGAPVINSIELKDTGVILSVTPRVNDSGRVILEIEQEVSSVIKTTTSGINSPTIQQRKVKTAVAISDGEALALGGLIQERTEDGKSKVPVLGDIPLLGNAFRSKTNDMGRTELLIFIRPRVIRDLTEARRITQEFREQLSIEAPRVRRGGDPTPGEELIRILQ
ncbi:type II secretion system secretin GspD [Taklimakanibacter lacteus]|uniref:type II secretion system secretin GspD n=1 Tax=Taklimakanibacter lacteus TaxID=2268456 RepID=UPI000E670B3A